MYVQKISSKNISKVDDLTGMCLIKAGTHTKITKDKFINQQHDELIRILKTMRGSK